MDSFIQYILSWPSWYLSLFIFLISLLEYIFPPFPSDTILLFGGYLGSKNAISLYALYISSSLGSFTGSYTVYLISLKLGYTYFKKKKIKFLESDGIKLFEKWYKIYGSKVIAINRFIPIIRPFTFIAAGIFNISPISVGIYSFISIIIWNTLLILIGWKIGLEWEDAKILIGNYSKLVGILFIAIICIYIFFKKFNK